ncbi:hypothetical protein [Aestuariibacter salexigens]|uniref:hypothetical protein n=1 Tax=Aestuariibacter salexigens TaxID=226010 RepID=UPI00042346ED|nr:hypothetical protein [Aestuariibacter salexigens]
MQFSRQNKYGGFTITVDEPFIHAQVQGVCSSGLWHEFNELLEKAALCLQHKRWAGLADLSDLQAWPKHVETALQETYKICLNSGCYTAAFLFGCAIVPNQLRNVEQALGIQGKLSNHTFDNKQAAMRYLGDQCHMS